MASSHNEDQGYVKQKTKDHDKIAHRADFEGLTSQDKNEDNAEPVDEFEDNLLREKIAQFESQAEKKDRQWWNSRSNV